MAFLLERKSQGRYPRIGNSKADINEIRYSASSVGLIAAVAAGDNAWQWMIPKDEFNANPNIKTQRMSQKGILFFILKDYWCPAKIQGKLLPGKSSALNIKSLSIRSVSPFFFRTFPVCKLLKERRNP